VVDILAELWQENDRAKPSARKLLLRWRPEVLGEERSATPIVKKEGEGQLAKESANGTLEVKAVS
jgi:symplekin